MCTPCLGIRPVCTLCWVHNVGSDCGLADGDYNDSGGIDDVFDDCDGGRIGVDGGCDGRDGIDDGCVWW